MLFGFQVHAGTKGVLTISGMRQKEQKCQQYKIDAEISVKTTFFKVPDLQNGRLDLSKIGSDRETIIHYSGVNGY